MKYPVIKEGVYTLKVDNEHKYTQSVSILQVGTSVTISFYNSFIEKNIIMSGGWMLNEKQNGYILHVTNSYNNKKMVFSIDKCTSNDYFTLKGSYESDDNYIFLIEK
jgi:hypothetical protein